MQAGALAAVLLLAAACKRDDDLIASFRVNASEAAGASGGASAGGGTAGGAAGSALAAGDGGESAQAAPSPCAPPVGALSPLARFDFEDAEGSTVFRDSQALQDAELRDGTFTPVLGPEGCGNALSFDTDGLYAVIANLPAWDLESGSVDFWFRVPDDVPGSFGILGRDHQGTDLPGHLALWLTSERTVTARLQGATLHATHCTEEPLALGQWAHLGFNFGPPASELWVNGRLAGRTGDPHIATLMPECGGSTPDGIAGNEQPWVLGFDTSRSGASLDGLLQHFDGGALDALQISAQRRDFRAP